MIAVDGNTLRVRFDRFDIEAYRTFLRVKSLPEYQLHFDESDESYTVTAPARFAAMLGVELPGTAVSGLPFSEFLFDDQRAITSLALEGKRFACWSDCGLGKTIIELEWARQVQHLTGGKVLGFTLNDIVPQFCDMASEFYGHEFQVERLTSREHMREWCKSPGPGIGLTNYEKMNHDKGDQVVNEMRYLAGVFLDESSRLKTGGGKQKWALIKSCKGIEYKLSCTATPAPNEIAEFASQASFLEKMRSDADIIWTYFMRDPKTHRWTVKKHARKAFFDFMSSWSIYVRDPRRYGWRKNHADIPAPVVMLHPIPMTGEQRTALHRFSVDPSGQLSLFNSRDTNTIQRAKLSQIAKGFAYRKSEAGRMFDRIDSKKPDFIADLVAGEAAAGLQTLVWTVFDAESTLLSEVLRSRGVEHDVLTGRSSDEERLAMLNRFRRGESRVLVSRAAMLGYGMNFQMCGSMVFSGWNDSYEAYYQAIRRAYRYGQTKALRVHIPVIEELEGDMLENIFHKESQHEAAIAEMEANYIAAMKRLTAA